MVRLTASKFAHKFSFTNETAVRHPTSSHGKNTFDQPAPTEIPMDGHREGFHSLASRAKLGTWEEINAAVARDEAPDLATSENTGTPHSKDPCFTEKKSKKSGYVLKEPANVALGINLKFTEELSIGQLRFI